MAVPGPAGCFCKVYTPRKKDNEVSVKYNLLTHVIDIVEIINIDTSIIHLCTVQGICRLKRGTIALRLKKTALPYTSLSRCMVR